ncbi:GntR family transcriptional regulator [Frondihabitans cladoniiphilus]|uniref:GntR family transcriptional regulator n=1 Tax=Frondihabitans cladoniiphilus TaxID=715785 RepID=A0ABP8W4L5_9MICO
MTVLTPTDPSGAAAPGSTADRAYALTKARIIRGDLPGGTAISENVVCLELGMSRTPVHEAFLRLAAEELLTLESRKGAVVRPMSPSEADDVVEMREAIESAAARRVVRERGQDALLPLLRDLLTRQAAALAADDVDAFVEADDEFHTAVVEASRNPIAAHFSRLLHDRAQRLRHHLMRIQPSHLHTSFADHRELADALEAGDGDAYAAVLGRHVEVLRGLL